MKMKHKTFIEMFRKLQELFAEYGIQDEWSLEREEYSRQLLIYVGLYEDGLGNYTTEEPEEDN